LAFNAARDELMDTVVALAQIVKIGSFVAMGIVTVAMGAVH